MKKKDIIDLIIAHYEGDGHLFFSTAMKVLREFKADGDDLLVEHVGNILKTNAIIAPRREPCSEKHLISFDDAASLDWIPMEAQSAETNEDK